MNISYVHLLTSEIFVIVWLISNKKVGNKVKIEIDERSFALSRIQVILEIIHNLYTKYHASGVAKQSDQHTSLFFNIVKVVADTRTVCRHFKNKSKDTRATDRIKDHELERITLTCTLILSHFSGDFPMLLIHLNENNFTIERNEVVTKFISTFMEILSMNTKHIDSISSDPQGTGTKNGNFEVIMSILALNHMYQNVLTILNGNDIMSPTSMKIFKSFFELSIKSNIINRALENSTMCEFRRTDPKYSNLHRKVIMRINFKFLLFALQYAEVVRDYSLDTGFVKNTKAKALKYQSGSKECGRRDHLKLNHKQNLKSTDRSKRTHNDKSKKMLGGIDLKTHYYIVQKYLAKSDNKNTLVWYLVHPDPEIQSLALKILMGYMKYKESDGTNFNLFRNSFFSSYEQPSLIWSGFIMIIFGVKEKCRVIGNTKGVLFLDSTINSFANEYFSENAIEKKSRNLLEGTKVASDKSSKDTKGIVYHSMFLLAIHFLMNKSKIDAPVHSKSTENKRISNWMEEIKVFVERSGCIRRDIMLNVTRLIVFTTLHVNYQVCPEIKETNSNPTKSAFSDKPINQLIPHIYVRCNDKPTKILMECPSIEKIRTMTPALANKVT